MERKNVFIVIFIITTIIASCIAMYFAIVDSNELLELRQTVNDLIIEVQEYKLEGGNNSNSGMTEQEALNIANDIYKKAYDVFETNSNELNNYFTKKAMSKYDSWKSLHSDSLYMNTIFSHTGKKIRPLSIVTYTNDQIIVTGQITSIEEGETTIKTDAYPFYLVLVKENGNWLIDCFE